MVTFGKRKEKINYIKRKKKWKVWNKIDNTKKNEVTNCFLFVYHPDSEINDEEDPTRKGMNYTLQENNKYRLNLVGNAHREWQSLFEYY